MQLKLIRSLARPVRQAFTLSALGLLLAIAIGVGGYAMTAASGRDGISIASATSATTPSELSALSAVARPAFAVEATSAAVAAAPLRDQALPQARVAATDPQPADGIVVAASAARRTIDAPASSTPKLAPGDRIGVPVSFYYCDQGAGSAGDGGGFCGRMRDGSVVYNGAAACDVAYLGQRFRIQGDPLERIYKCADTGSAVHGLHRDIWFQSSDQGWSWQLSVGQAASIEILP